MDRANPVTFNHALWRGLKGNEPYPGPATGADLKVNRVNREFVANSKVTGDNCVLPASASNRTHD
jgi:hypothetical protein